LRELLRAAAQAVERFERTGTRSMYHDPCHSPIKKYDLTVVNSLMNSAQNGSIEQVLV
jgi:hypothetical protein